MTATAKGFLAALASQVGYREGRDPDGNWNNDTKFGRWYGLNFQPWCGMFQSWGANEVSALGIKVPKYASCTAGLNWFRSRGQTGVFPPRPGDIGILLEYAPNRWNAQPNGWAPIHTFACERWVYDTGSTESGFAVTLEGNTNLGGSSQGNGVYRLQRRDSRTNNGIIWCRPAWDPEPVVVPPTTGGGGESTIPTSPTPTPTAPLPTIPAPPRFSTTTAILLNDENLRLGKVSDTAGYYNPRIWSWLYYNGGKAFCQANYAAWMKEPSRLYGSTSVKATKEAYRLLNKKDPKAWPASSLTATWPGPGLLRILGLRAD